MSEVKQDTQGRGIQKRTPPPANQPANQPWVRWMITADEAQVLAIEREAFENPWSVIDFRVYRERRNHVCWVAEIQGQVCAYVAYELQPKSLAIHNLAVRSDLRRNGIGTILVAALAAKLRPGRQGRHKLTVEVRETNLAAQLFFKSCGFRVVATIDRPYVGTDEDAYLFRFTLGLNGEGASIGTVAIPMNPR